MPPPCGGQTCQTWQCTLTGHTVFVHNTPRWLGTGLGAAEARGIPSPLGIQPMVSSKCRSEEALVSGQEAPCCPLGFFPPSGWPRSQAWSTQSLPVQRSAACLLGPLTGLAFPGDPSITPAKWTQRVMAPLKRQMSLRLEESEGSPLQHPAPSSTQPLRLQPNLLSHPCAMLPSAGEKAEQQLQPKTCQRGSDTSQPQAVTQES